MKWFLLVISLFLLSCSTVTDFNSCGDGVLDSDETCDATSFGGLTCSDFGFSGGRLQCSGDCGAIDTSQCDCTSCGTTECLDLMNDPHNCGSCGTSCEDDELCVEGTCGYWEQCGDTWYLPTVMNGETACDGTPTPGNSHTCAYLCCDDKPVLWYDAGNTKITGNPDYCGGCLLHCGDGERCVSIEGLQFQCQEVK